MMMLNRTRNPMTPRSDAPRNRARLAPASPRPDAKRYSDPESRWQAVCDRDDRADGAFIYAVRTTGVYCRPTCRSRLPLRRNVRFFDAAPDARREGFRPCKRCAPDADRPVDPHRAIILSACRRLEAEAAPPLAELARDADLTPWHFQRVFKRLVGVSPKQYAIARRVRRFQDRLTPGATVMDAALDAGFSSTGRAYAVAGPRLGMSASVRRRGGRGELIRSTVVESPVGLMLVAATDKGVCSVAFGSNADELRRRLLAEFPQARHVHDGARVRSLARRVLARVSRPHGGNADSAVRPTMATTQVAGQAASFAGSTGRDRKPPLKNPAQATGAADSGGSRLDASPRCVGDASADELPLDVRGTAFQHLVWNALRRIEPGRTATYAELARDIGRPRAARAVGRACAENRLAVLIPCHRLVPAEGGIGEYRWGRRRKQRLLEIENANLDDEPPRRKESR
ncbi:MAG: Bifunctional transcriptional activator/DNA repair enzyme Ada [Phycisphaerae bacterium]|nr:Bifunctional transcriptional activator/DNA repair enzyme Ada [Phycisphaerae bacterium]